MQTEWHDYKSAVTKRVGGSYFYLPETSDDVICHARFVRFGCVHIHSYVAWLSDSGPFPSLEAAKLYAARKAADHFGLKIPPEPALQASLF